MPLGSVQTKFQFQFRNVHEGRRSRGLGSSGQVVKRKNCTRSRGQGSFSVVKNLDRGHKRSYGKHRSGHPLVVTIIESYYSVKRSLTVKRVFMYKSAFIPSTITFEYYGYDIKPKEVQTNV